MTRAFLWFVMIATLGGCGADLIGMDDHHVHVPGPSYEETAEVGPFSSAGLTAQIPFQAAPGQGWEAPVEVPTGYVIETVKLEVVPIGDRMPSLVLVKEANGVRQAITGGEADELGITFDVHLVAEDADYSLVFLPGDGAMVQADPVVAVACEG